ncbi:MAG: glycosyltransferase family 4 protein [Candidatus Nealsonbacteria bacterium]|nr:glycosyltransferase family 4 protein [Candidatus Nealsonbacteria bacterium]
MRIKILILAGNFPPLSMGGAGFSVFGLARGLQKAGCEVFVVTTCQDKSGEKNFKYQGLQIFRIFANYHERWRAYLSLYNPQAVGKVRYLIEKISPDVIHAHNINWYLSYHCLKIAKEFKKPVFFTARDTMEFTYGKLATRRYLNNFDAKVSWLDNLKQAQKRYNPVRNFLIRKYLKNADKIFSVSNALKDALNQNGIQNVETVYTGIDVADWKIGQDAVRKFKKKRGLLGKKIVFFGGRISGLKGLGQIDRAMDMVKKEVPKAVLLVAGKEGIGWLEGDELKAAYWSADIVVVPSIYLDPFPRSNLEAMACKKPVIATCYGGSPEIVKDGLTGYAVNPLNAELMAKKIIDLLEHPQKAKKLGQAGYERVKKDFNLDTHVAKTLSWYKSLLQQLR